MNRAWWTALRARLMVRRMARARWRQVLPGTRVTPPATAWLRTLPHRLARLRLRWQVALGGGLVAVAGLILDGPMAGLILAGYATTAIVLIRRSRTTAAHAQARRFAVDAVAALAADLRAGLPVGPAIAAATPLLRPAVPGPEVATIGRRVLECVAVAESSGAPLADVLDRLDVHLRAVGRARASAAAQAAGARASAALLAALPVAGAGMGYLVSADPRQVLLHTGFGAACLGGAAALQLAGLAWTMRLSRIDVAE
jgi:tight adherence protein B